MLICFECGKPIRGRPVRKNNSARFFFSRVYHAKCYAKAERAAGDSLRRSLSERPA